MASAQVPATRPRLSSAAASGRLWRLSPIGVGVIAFALGLVALTKQKLSYDETVLRYSETVPKGDVIGSQPRAGTTLKPGAPQAAP